MSQNFGICHFLGIDIVKLAWLIMKPPSVSLRIVHINREECLHDEDDLDVPYPKKKLSRFPDRSCVVNSLFHLQKKSHNPILNDLLKRVYQKVMLDHLQQKHLQGSCFRNIFSSMMSAIRFIITFDFAVTRSSPESC